MRWSDVGKKAFASTTKKNSHGPSQDCSMKGIFLLNVGGDDCLNDTLDDINDVEISLHTMIGSCMSKTMCLPISMKDQTLTALVDSGSSHCFMATQVVCHMNLNPTTKDDMTMGVTNGERLPCLGVCSMPSFSIHGESFCINFLIITLEGYEVVLECNWLCLME
jgi:hypothetical protein